MIVTRDEILDAIDRLYMSASDLNCGLCSAFDVWSRNDELHCDLPEFLSRLGGKPFGIGYFWPTTRQGRQQRLLFLAFMLTWLDEIERGTCPSN
jgi:hypothetical protein